MLGGIRMPNVPLAQTVPLARALLYPRFIIDGRAISASIVTEAAITPTAAARMVPTTTVVIASPPLCPPNQSYAASYIRAAIPERSNMQPMKIKSGTASRT